MTGQLLTLALLSAITSPTAIAAVLLILSRPRAIPLLAAYVIGSFVASMVVGLAAVEALKSIGTFNPGQRSANPTVHLVAGVLVLATAAFLRSDRSSPIRRRAAAMRAERKARHARKGHEGPSRTTRLLSRGSVGITVALGVAMHLPGMLYLVALTDVAHESLSTPHTIAVLAAFNAIMLLPIELPLIAFAVAPRWTKDTLDRMDAWLRANERRAIQLTALAAGGYLIVVGLVGLLG